MIILLHSTGIDVDGAILPGISTLCFGGGPEPMRWSVGYVERMAGTIPVDADTIESSVQGFLEYEVGVHRTSQAEVHR